MFDLVVSVAGLIALFPLIALVALVIAVKSGKPVFYLQKRVGKDAKLFNCVKFRTMVEGGEKKGSITCSTDDRFTSEGTFLRRYKIDELPQLWNVAIGKMSFVGPRPDVPGYADNLSGRDRTMLSLKPGITGPASIYFRYEEEILARVADPKKVNDTIIWPVKVRINMEYCKNWSFLKDIGYILITVFPALSRVFKLVNPSPRTIEQVH